MILRPAQNQNASTSEAAGKPAPAWTAIERSQHRRMREWWLIPQPAHAALSGEIAAQLRPDLYLGLDANVIRAIALHDAGWGPIDAEAIQTARSAAGATYIPASFLDLPAASAVRAWNGSITTAEKVCATGGYLVSLHFSTIARMNEAAPADAKTIGKFLQSEQERQQRLRKKISLPEAELQRLFEALQFCDLLSLYICCGVEEAVEFPQTLDGQKIALKRGESAWELAPSPLTGEHLFTVAAIRHPKRKAVPSSASFALLLR